MLEPELSTRAVEVAMMPLETKIAKLKIIIAAKEAEIQPLRRALERLEEEAALAK